MGTVGVNGAGDKFLAHAAFSEDQHRMRALGDLGQNAVQLVHLRAAADHVTQPLGQNAAIRASGGFSTFCRVACSMARSSTAASSSMAKGLVR